MVSKDKNVTKSKPKVKLIKKTNNFYLPFSDFDLLKNVHISLVGENIGFSKFQFQYDFEYISLNAFLGDCVTSMFCIETSVND